MTDHLAYQRLYAHLRKQHRISIAVLSGCRDMRDLRDIHATAQTCNWKEKP